MKAHFNRSPFTPAIILVLVAGVSALSAGCATFPENEVGNHADRMSTNGLQLTLRPTSGEHHLAGAPLVFEVTLTNTGSHPINIPKEPYLSLKWRYPNGLMDSTLPPDGTGVVGHSDDLVTIEPGKSLRLQKQVETSHIPYYKRRLGIIEFRAAYCSEFNPQTPDQKLWDGVSFSNTYGVVLAGR